MYISLWIYLFCLCGKGWESYLVQIIIATLILEGLLLYSRNQIIIATLILESLLLYSRNQINLMTLIYNFILQFCVLREETYGKKPARRIPVKKCFSTDSFRPDSLHCVEF